MYNFSSMKREIIFIFFACISLSLNQDTDTDGDDDDMMDGVDEENIVTEDLEFFKGESKNVDILFENSGQESDSPIKNCTIKHPDGERYPVDLTLGDKFDGRIKCVGQCQVSD